MGVCAGCMSHDGATPITAPPRQRGHHPANVGTLHPPAVVCGSDPSTPTVDCSGTRSTCTAVCEVSADLTWNEIIAQSGFGAACQGCHLKFK